MPGEREKICVLAGRDGNFKGWMRGAFYLFEMDEKELFVFGPKKRSYIRTDFDHE